MDPRQKADICQELSLRHVQASHVYVVVRWFLWSRVAGAMSITWELTRHFSKIHSEVFPQPEIALLKLGVPSPGTCPLKPTKLAGHRLAGWVNPSIHRVSPIPNGAKWVLSIHSTSLGVVAESVLFGPGEPAIIGAGQAYAPEALVPCPDHCYLREHPVVALS